MFEKLSLALFGALVGWLLSWHRYRVAENANLINDHIADMERFAEALRVHWTTSYKHVAPDVHRADIAKIKAQHTSVSSFYGEAESRLGTASFRNYQVLQLRLFTVGMGGDFETVSRSVDENAAIDSQVIAWEIIQSLRSARREQYGLMAAIHSTWRRWRGQTKQHV
ncbi:hypothetical protein [Tritonibacter mobilis]|uniref:hypothetical protein n=1 Tax=Tritonibacter mobilis TaxID=379347 RepID=UPI000F7E0E16|nr:hypothetical protein [Tritonibacter mobilis]